jgi:YggT family protein
LSRNGLKIPFPLPRGLARRPLQGYTSAGHPFPERISMIELLGFISYLITLYTYIVIANVILSWLMAFGVVNPYNPTVRVIWQALNALVEPLLRPIRAVMPNLGAVDLSPIVLLLGCFFVQSVVLPNIAKLFV